MQVMRASVASDSVAFEKNIFFCSAWHGLERDLMAPVQVQVKVQRLADQLHRAQGSAGHLEPKLQRTQRLKVARLK